MHFSDFASLIGHGLKPGPQVCVDFETAQQLLFCQATLLERFDHFWPQFLRLLVSVSVASDTVALPHDVVSDQYPENDCGQILFEPHLNAALKVIHRRESIVVEVTLWHFVEF